MIDRLVSKTVSTWEQILIRGCRQTNMHNPLAGRPMLDLDNALLYQPWQSPTQMSAYRLRMEHHNQGGKIELLMIRLLDVPGFSPEVKDAIGRSALMPALLDTILPKDYGVLPSAILKEIALALDQVAEG